MKNILLSLFLWFYCLDLPDATAIILAATVLFSLLHSRFADRRWWSGMIGFMLICWILVIACATVLMRSSNEFQHNFVPFHSYREAWNSGKRELFRSNFMNIILFYPAGLLATSLLPQKWPGWVRCFPVVLLLAATSAGIEFLQYCYALGRCEIDDLIHNTAGALVGCATSLIFPSVISFLMGKVRKIRLPNS